MMVDSASLHLQSRFWLSQSKPNSLLLPKSFTACYKLHSPSNPNSTKFHSPHFSLSLVHAPPRIGFHVFAQKKPGRGVTQPTDSDIEFDEFFDEDGADFQNEEEEEEEVLLPLKKMKEWLAGRPRGFGEGKEYDTSIEDKLLQELEQSRAAQATNINKLKNQTSEPNSSKSVAEIKAPDIVSTGVRIRIVNLPKKKNIHRDLVVAFKEFPGIINIVPAVVGNKKTRDPICKGFAFVDCESKGDAIRFLEAFSGQYLTFGRVQKQIKCEMINRQTSSSARESSVGSNNHPLPIIPEYEAEQDADLDKDLADEVIRTRVEDMEENLVSMSELHSDDEEDNGAESGSESKIRSPSRKELDKIHELEEILPNGREEVRRKMPPIKGKTKVSKKKQPKEKGKKKSLTEIPGSAKRLRVKEKAVLTDVYSRYGNKSAALISKEGN